MKRSFERVFLTALFAGGVILMGVFCLFRGRATFEAQPNGTYATLSPDTLGGDPLSCIDPEDFTVSEDFSSHLPIVIISPDGELPDYKDFVGDAWEESVFTDVDPYTDGTMKILDNGTGENTLSDAAIYESTVRLKVRGHSSYYYDKKQYKIKTLLPDGTSNDTDILGMGKGSEWVLNGSLADKSLIRNYLAYRIASEIDGNNMAPDSRFCEVIMERGGTRTYEGVYLLMETITRGEERVNIDKYNEKNTYSSYIVRRDRFTSFDIMLDTYGRQSGLAVNPKTVDTDGFIGLKYPAAPKVSERTVNYIADDFSRMEKVLYSDNYAVFQTYDRYIDVNSFVDYFLINEFFGNYDAGEHSTYMYKNSGDVLYIGPVWDYDQALDNSQSEEMKTDKLAFQTETLFKQLCEDKTFVRNLKNRYVFLRENQLAEEHIFDIIDETSAYLAMAKERDYFRWAASYNVNKGKEPNVYVLQPYQKGSYMLSRYTEEYEQNLVVIRHYLHEHGNAIEGELDGVLRAARYDTVTGGVREMLFIACVILFLLPSYLILRRG